MVRLQIWRERRDIWRERRDIWLCEGKARAGEGPVNQATIFDLMEYKCDIVHVYVSNTGYVCVYIYIYIIVVTMWFVCTD